LGADFWALVFECRLLDVAAARSPAAVGTTQPSTPRSHGTTQSWHHAVTAPRSHGTTQSRHQTVMAL